MRSAMVPLDRALMISYRLSIVTITLSVTLWLPFAILLCKFRLGVPIPNQIPKSPLPVGGPGSCIYHVTWTTRVSLLNGLSFRPTALAGCTSVTDIHTDRPHHTELVCRNRQHCRFQRYRLIILIILVSAIQTQSF